MLGEVHEGSCHRGLGDVDTVLASAAQPELYIIIRVQRLEWQAMPAPLLIS